MRERKHDTRGAHARKERGPLRIEVNVRRMAQTMVNRDGFPAEFGADAGGEGLRYGFFRGKARGKMLVRVLHRETVGAFLIGKHARKKTFTLPFEHAADAIDFDDVAAETKQDAASRKIDVHR